MANSDIVWRMLQIIDDHEAGRITSSEAEHEIENHMQAMERIGLPEIHQSRNLTYRLVTSWFRDGDEEYGVEEDAADVRAKMRDFLRSLPGADVGEQNDARERPSSSELNG
jgi:hypothetical protein